MPIPLIIVGYLSYSKAQTALMDIAKDRAVGITTDLARLTINVIQTEMDKARAMAGQKRIVELGQAVDAFGIEANELMVGEVFAHPNQDLVLKLDVNSIPDMASINKPMMAGETGVEEYVFKGVAKIAGFAPVGINGWSISATQDIAGVSVSMNEMSTSSSQVNLSAQELSKLSETLKQMVDQFKV